MTDYSSMSRVELLRLCKAAGLKANGKTEVLVEQLRAHAADSAPARYEDKVVAVKTEAETAKTSDRRTVSTVVKEKAPVPKQGTTARKARASSAAPSAKDLSASKSKAAQLASIRHDIAELVTNSNPLDDLAGRIEARRAASDDDGELLRLIDARLEVHKRDVLALVDARIRALDAPPPVPPVPTLSTSRSIFDFRAQRQASPERETQASLLPPVTLAERASPSRPREPSPFLALLEAPLAPTLPPQPILGSAEKRKRTTSCESDLSIVLGGPLEPVFFSPAPVHIRKKPRTEAAGDVTLVTADAPTTSTPLPSVTLAPPAPSTAGFSFGRRSVGGTLYDPPPYPLSPPGRKDRDTRFGPLPFAPTAGPQPVCAPTPPARKTLFGTERDGGGGAGKRFGDLATSPSRKWRWTNWTIGSAS